MSPVTEGLIYSRKTGWRIDKSKLSRDRPASYSLPPVDKVKTTMSIQDLKERKWTFEARLRTAPQKQKPKLREQIAELTILIGDTNG